MMLLLQCANIIQQIGGTSWAQGGYGIVQLAHLTVNKGAKSPRWKDVWPLETLDFVCPCQPHDVDALPALGK